MQRLAEFIIRFRWGVILFFAVVTFGFMAQIPGVVIDTDLKTQLPKSMASRIDTEKIDELFGGTEMLMVIVQTDDVLKPETLKRLRSLSRKINRVDGVEKVLSLFDLKSIRNEEGVMIVESAVPGIPNDEAEREKLRADLRNNSLVYGSVVSKDFRLTALIALLATEARDEDVIPVFKQIIADTPGEETVMLGGMPVFRLALGESIKKDLRLLLPIGIFIMLIFLYACFRRIRGVALPFLIVVMSILVSIGFIVVVGWKIHMVTIILPILMVAIANNYGIHMVAKYQEDNVPGNTLSEKQLAARMFTSLGYPVLLTGLTTIAGMLCLFSHILIPAQQLGVLAGFGVFYALFASLFLIPAVSSFLPRSKPVLFQNDERSKKPLLERQLWFFSRIVSQKPKGVILAALLLALVSVFGVFRVVVDTNPASYYKADDPVVVSNNLIDDYLGGSQNISVVYQGDIKSPDLVKKIDAMEQQLAGMDEVGATLSIAQVLRQMSLALNDPDDPMYGKLPDTRNAVAQYFELYSMSGDPADFSKMVDFPYEHAIVTARINKNSTSIMEEVVERIKTQTAGDPDVLLVGGYGVVLSDLAKAVVSGQVSSLMLATTIVAALVAILFRSVVAGMISAVPLALSILVLFGLMGVVGIELNIATAMLSSIMIGAGVDYTIHFLWRYREERRAGLDPASAAQKTLTTTGRGIIFNAVSVMIGFAALFFSSFLPVQFFGFLVVISIFACLIGALVLVPAVCIVIKPKFLEPKSIV